jgi:N-acetylglucosamine kinase-like BadF-type ATPase
VAFIVGVDGGATKTVALIATGSGRIVGRGRSGSSNYQNVGSMSASEAIRTAVNEALNAAHLRRKDVAVAGVSLAGIDSSRDITAVRQFVGWRLGLSDRG